MGTSSFAKTDLRAADLPQFQTDSKGRLMVPENWTAPDGFSGTVITPAGIQMDYAGPMRKAQEPKGDMKNLSQMAQFLQWLGR